VIQLVLILASLVCVTDLLMEHVYRQVNTVFQLTLVAGAILQPEFGNPDTQTWITYLR